MFLVKICGVTSAADARMVASAGADAIGLNFVAGSPRRLGVEEARQVAAAIPPGVLKVGVFAGTPAAEVRAVARQVPLDAVQLHGHLELELEPNDPPERCAQLAGLPVIRAVRLDASRFGMAALAAARDWLDAAFRAGGQPVMVIVDAMSRGASAGSLGGTGAVVDWPTLARAGGLSVPLALAGGLTPANVAEAIRVVGPAAVDTASGVECSPGRKDRAKVEAFVAAARRALSRRS